MRYYFTPVKMGIIIKTGITTAEEDVEKKEHSHTADGNVH